MEEIDYICIDPNTGESLNKPEWYSQKFDIIKEYCELDGKKVIEKDHWINPDLDYVCETDAGKRVFTQDECNQEGYYRLNFEKLPYPIKMIRANIWVIIIIIIALALLYFTIFIRSI